MLWVKVLNAFMTIVFCSHLLVLLGSLYCKQYGLRGSSLIRVHSVCLNDNIYSEVHLSICSRSKKQTTFSGHKIVVG